MWPSLFARLNGAQRDRIEEVLAIIGLAESRYGRAGVLSHGQKQWLEIGMLLMQNPRLLLLDEPVAGMTHEEAERTAELLLSTRRPAHRYRRGARHGVRAFHRAPGYGACTKGGCWLEGKMQEVQNHPKVIEVYLGA